MAHDHYREAQGSRKDHNFVGCTVPAISGASEGALCLKAEIPANATRCAANTEATGGARQKVVSSWFSASTGSKNSRWGGQC